MRSLFKLSALCFMSSPLSFFASADVEVNQHIDDSKQLERITVTASRKEMLDTDLAMSVHGVGESELSIDNGQHVAESLNSISGVLINQLSGGQGHKTAIRMPMNVSGYYLFLQDNIPLQSAAFFNHNALWWSSFNSNVSRMEVLKGAGTALHGSGAVAATINVLSNPISSQPENNVALTLGADNYVKVQASHSQQINDQHALRVSSSYLNNDGWRDHTGSRRGEVSVTHEYNISSSESLSTSFIVSDLEQEMASSLSNDEYEEDRTGSGLSEDVLNSDPLRKSQYMRLSTQWDKSAGDAFYSLIPYARYRSNDYTATWNQNMPKVESSVFTLGLLALANFEHNDSNETTIGVDLEYSAGDQYSYQPLNFTTTGWNPDTFSAGDEFYDDTTIYTGVSPYIQHKRALTERIDLTLGARFDYAHYDFDNKLGEYGDIDHGFWSLEDTDDSFSHFSPKASLNYQLTDNSSTYFRYANSFRLPTASNIFHLTTEDSGVAQSVDPEISDTFEIGYKANFDTVTFDAALYYMDVSDGIVQAYNETSGQRYLTNASKVIHKGVEVALDWEVTPTFNASITYSKSSHKFDTYIDEDGYDYAGNTMTSSPDYIANLRLRYSPQALPNFSSMIEVQSIGEYWMDDKNTIDDEGEAKTNSGYTVMNAKFHYDVTPQLSLNARVLNVLDDDYIREVIIRWGENIYPGAPRTIYAGFNYRW